MINKKGLHILLLVIITIVTFIKTKDFDFAVDDKIYITNNENTKSNSVESFKNIWTNSSFIGYSTIEKSSTYRPITMTILKLEYLMFNTNSRGYHLINLLLYTLLGVMLYFLLIELGFSPLWSITISLLFIIIPIHVEVISNIKSQEVLLMSLFFVSSLYFSLKKQYAVSLLFCLLSLLSKETGVICVPLLIYMQYSHTQKIDLKLVLPLILVSIYFLARLKALGNVNDTGFNILNNGLYAEENLIKRFFLSGYLQLEYIKNLVFPNKTLYVYSTGHFLFDSSKIALGFMYYMLLGFIGYKVYKKNLRILTISFMIYVLPIFVVGNVLFMNGSMYAERFYFISSLGLIMMVAVYVKPLLIKQNRTALYSIFSILALTSIYQSIKLSEYWRNDEVALQNMIENSSGYYSFESRARIAWDKNMNISQAYNVAMEYSGHPISYLEGIKAMYYSGIKEDQKAVLMYKNIKEQEVSNLPLLYQYSYLNSLLIIGDKKSSKQLIEKNKDLIDSDFIYLVALQEDLASKSDEAYKLYNKADSVDNYLMRINKSEVSYKLSEKYFNENNDVKGLEYIYKSTKAQETFSNQYLLSKYHYSKSRKDSSVYYIERAELYKYEINTQELANEFTKIYTELTGKQLTK